MIERSARHVKDLRIALDGCYPSFWHTDLVMRILRCFSRPKLVSRLRPHDLLIRGPFSKGSKRLRIADRAIEIVQGLKKTHYEPLTLHVCSENHALPNYQSFAESNCDFGIGHEILSISNYTRMPHWLNYLNLSSCGVSGPEFWPRLGAPIEISELSSILNWNSSSQAKAVFVTSNMTIQRLELMNALNQVIPVVGFGKAFDSSIPNHSNSGFNKRNLLAEYQYSFCPENSLSPGYYTEKTPEAFISGCIPITFADRNLNIDFSPDSLVNLVDFIRSGVLDTGSLEEHLNNSATLEKCLNTPLISYDLHAKCNQLIEFIADIYKLILA